MADVPPLELAFRRIEAQMEGRGDKDKEEIFFDLLQTIPRNLELLEEIEFIANFAERYPKAPPVHIEGRDERRRSCWARRKEWRNKHGGSGRGTHPMRSALMRGAGTLSSGAAAPPLWRTFSCPEGQHCVVSSSSYT